MVHQKVHRCDNIAIFLPFPHHSDNLCSLQSPPCPSSNSAPAPALLPTPSFSSLSPYDSCFVLQTLSHVTHLYTMSLLVCITPCALLDLFL